MFPTKLPSIGGTLPGIVRYGHGFSEIVQHEASDGTFSNSDTPFQDYVIPMRMHHFPSSDTP